MDEIVFDPSESSFCAIDQVPMGKTRPVCITATAGTDIRQGYLTAPWGTLGKNCR